MKGNFPIRFTCSIRMDVLNIRYIHGCSVAGPPQEGGGVNGRLFGGCQRDFNTSRACFRFSGFRSGILLVLFQMPQ